MDTGTVFTSLIVSAIALSVIFTVLIILIFTIKLMVHLMPYEEPPVPAGPARAPSPSSTEGTPPEIVAAVTAALATHLGKSPDAFHITRIDPKR